MSNRCAMIHKSQIPDPFLYELWDRLCDSKIEKLTFYDGAATDHHSFRDFVRFHGTHFWAMFYDKEPAGFMWVNGIQGRSGYAHFAFFKEFRGEKAITLGRFGNASILRFKDDKDRYLLDVLIGVTPRDYKLALRFVKRCGAVVCGEIPYGTWFAETDQTQDAIISSVTRESTEESWIHA
ncbi:MAG: hypothetical protein LBR82_01945 [Desulfovibrio sp.]|nr:hypothetical protein [Desulfovibrio sp.]